MTDIVIREVAASPDGVIEARVDFGQDGGADVRVADPADAEQEQLLAWYFEKHLEYPFLDKDLEEKAAAQIDAYGQALFGQVFGGEAAYGYRRARDRGFDGCRLVIEGSAAMHRFHWEALQDPDTRGGRLALRLPVVRRVDRIPLQFELPLGRSVVRILVITARPDGPRDIGYRTISRPLLDAVRQARLPVAVDIVRPGTWEALRDRLRATSREQFNDRLGAARTYNNLGGLAQAQGRWGQAEEYYRQALDIKLTFEDRYGAVGTYHNLGWAMSKLGRHSGAVEAWLHAIALEQAEAGGWPEDTLGALRQERDLVPPDEFERLVGEIVPVESRDEFYEVLGGQAASS